MSEEDVKPTAPAEAPAKKAAKKASKKAAKKAAAKKTAQPDNITLEVEAIEPNPIPKKEPALRKDPSEDHRVKGEFKPEKKAKPVKGELKTSGELENGVSYQILEVREGTRTHSGHTHTLLLEANNRQIKIGLDYHPEEPAVKKYLKEHLDKLGFKK